MIPQVLLKLILPKIVDHVSKIFKLNKVLDYVENDNDLDIQYRDIEHKCTEIGFKVNAMQTVLKDLDDKSHPPAIDLDEWEDVKDTIKIVKNMKKFKSLNAKK